MNTTLFFRIRRCFFLWIFNAFFAGFTRFWKMKRTLLKLSGINVGKGTRIVGPFKCGNCANIIIGANSWIGPSFEIYGNGKIIVGSNCDIAPSVSIISGSHIIGGAKRRAGKGISYKIEIGDGCWIGAKSTLMGNIKIKDSSIIGACSLVNKNVDSNTCVGGVPAKIIRLL